MFNRLLPQRWKRRVHAALDAKFDSTRASLADAMIDMQRQLDARLTQQGAALSAQLAELRAETDTIRQSLFNQLDDGSLLRLRSAAGDLQRGLAALKNEVAAQLSFSLHDMATQVADQRLWLERINDGVAGLNLPARLGDVSDRITSQQERLQTIGVETTQLIARIAVALRPQLDKPETVDRLPSGDETSAAAARLAELGNGVAEQQKWLEKISTESTNLLNHLNTSLHTRLNTLENVILPELVEQVHEVVAVQVHAAALRADKSRWQPHPEERYAPAQAASFDAFLARAGAEFPTLFGLWRDRLDATSVAFDETMVGNAAHGGDLYSRVFRDFVKTYADGRVLDVGCGVFGRPYYLDFYPAELISGVEPLAMHGPAEFEVVRGIGEYLPWPDASFSTVISGTSLDHSLSLQRALDEIVRVVRPDGRVLLWVGSNPGAVKFEPERPDFAPADQFHLFHFDKQWFEPMLEQQFEMLDRIELKRPSYSHVFYCLRPKPPSEPVQIPDRHVASRSA